MQLKTAADAFEAISERAIQKTAEATGYLIENKKSEKFRHRIRKIYIFSKNTPTFY